MITARENPALLDIGRYPFVVDIPTRFADLDHNNHVNNVAMAAIFEEARNRFALDAGKPRAGAERGQMMAAHTIEYLGQARYPQDMRVGVGISAIGRSSWHFAVLATQNGRPCAFGDAVLVTTDGAASVPLADDLRGLLQGRLLSPELPPPPPPPQGPALLSPRTHPSLLDPARYPVVRDIPARLADLDGNDHINNVAAAFLLEDARMRFGYAGGASYMWGSGVPMMASHSIDYLGQMVYPGNLSISLAVTDIGRSSWRFVMLAMQNDVPCMFAVAVLVMTDGDKAIPIPDDIRGQLASTALRLD